jgi:hypothetical protein
MRRAAVAALLVVASLAAGCTGSERSDEPGTTTGGETQERSSVTVYLLRAGKVSPVRRMIDATPAVARAALSSLLAGPTAEEKADGLTTAIPPGTTLGGVDIADGVATVDLQSDVSLSGEERRRGAAQIVATLTQFPTVHAVKLGGGGLDVDGPSWNRHVIEQQLPQILIESPLPGDRVTSPIHVRGTANVFEATVSFEVRDSADTVVMHGFTTATSGNGTRGTFEAELAVPDLDGPATIVAFEASAEDGRPLHVVAVPLTVER